MTKASIKTLAICGAMAFAVAACSSGESTRNKQGMAGALMDGGMVTAVDLVALLDPQEKAKEHIGKRKWRRLEDGRKVDLAFEAFYNDYPRTSRSLRRNRAQERIMGASETTCNRLKQILLAQEKKSFARSMGSVVSTAGRIATGLNTSAALSGVYGVFSTGQKGFNKELFGSLTSQVIVSGIDRRRDFVAAKIRAKRKRSSITQYTAEAAIKDAVYYHEQCNVFSGMMTARDMMIDTSVQARL